MSGITEVERLRRADEILQSLLEHADGEHPALLDEACGDDAWLRAEVESLLSYRGRVKGFIETPAFALSAEWLAESHNGDSVYHDSSAQAVGQRIGLYQIVREIGRGGMGTVYLARRADEEFRKFVALKIVRRGMDTEDILRRFRNERQILAALDHPNIARLLDGGTTEDGLPYLVMEYVEGTPITEYCDRHRLSTNERLELFRTVCAAVQHAHQNLVVHRDLKPSNILVVEDKQTGKATPKLLDFGIAKVLNPELSSLPMEQTRTELRALTPDYASPEQLRGDKLTTASDIYSLGVVLYELLTGHRPYHARNTSPHEFERIISEEDPTRPSAAVSRTEQIRQGNEEEQTTITPESVSRSRDTQPEKLRRRLEGDLDNIVLMAMRKEPSRRYASAGQLSEDIRRHLEGLPVVARKDTFGYRAGKFIRRNRLAVAAAVVVLLSLVTGIVATLWQARRATEQARIAAQERDHARVAAAKAERINAFLQHILGFSDITWLSSNPRRNPNATIAEALDEASRRAESELADQPEVLAAVHLTIARAYGGLTRLDMAEPHLRAALDLRRKLLGQQHQDTAEAIMALGELLILKGNYEEAESLCREAVNIYRNARAAGDVKLRSLAIALNDLALAQNYNAHPVDAEANLREALEVAANFTGSDRYFLGFMYHNLALVRRSQGDLDGAIANEEKAIEQYRQQMGGTTADAGVALANLAYYVMLKGDYGRSESLFLEALETFKKAGVETHQNVTIALTNLAENYYGQGKYQQARARVDEAINIQKTLLPEGHVYFGLTYTMLGKILMRTGDLKGGEDYLRRALDVETRALPRGHRWTALTQSALGENLTMQKRYGQAEQLLTESYNTLNSSLGAQDPKTLEALRNLVTLYEAWGKTDAANQYRNRL